MINFSKIVKSSDREWNAYTPKTAAFVKAAILGLKNPPNYKKMKVEEYRVSVSGFKDLVGPPAPGVSESKLALPNSTDGAPLDCTLFATKDVEAKLSPIIIHFAGGGFIAQLDAYNSFCSWLSYSSGAKVLLVNCRLAPEHPFPVPLNDAFNAVKYVFRNAKKIGVDPNMVIVSGDSSGGSLAALCSHKGRYELKENRIAHVLLISPATDLSRSLHGYDKYEAMDIFPKGMLNYAYGLYLGETDPQDPRVSPYFEEDLSGLPPLTYIRAEFDGVSNDQAYADRRAQETPEKVKIIIVKGAIHAATLIRKPGMLDDTENPAVLAGAAIKKFVKVEQ